MDTKFQPIYIVVYANDHVIMNYSIYTIVAVYACDLSEIDKVYRDNIMPLFNSLRAVSTIMFSREPENPFKDFENVNQ